MDDHRLYRRLGAGWIFFVCALVGTPATHAQVVRDGSIGPGGPGLVAGGVDDLGQPTDYLIHEGLGERAGMNLFHSFSDFDIGASEVATFTATTPTEQVLSRVTGGSASTILGTLRSTIPGADLFLMNPAGVLFGEGSSLDVPASLHLTSAEYLRHADGAGTRFASVAMPPPLLSTAPVEAFGFLDGPFAPVAIENTRLDLSQDVALSLIGGAVSVRGHRPGSDSDPTDDSAFLRYEPLDFGPFGTASIRAPRGMVQLVAVQSAGEATWTAPGAALEVSSFGEFGVVELTDAGIDTGSNALIQPDQAGGTVRIRADGLHVRDGSAIAAESRGGPSVPRIGFDVALTGDFLFEDSVALGSAVIEAQTMVMRQVGDFGVFTLSPVDLPRSPTAILASSFGADPGGDLDIRVDTLTLEGPVFTTVQLGTDTYGGSGDAGDVRVSADAIVIDTGRVFAFSTSPFFGRRALAGAGDHGNIEVRAQDLLLTNGGFITRGGSGGGSGGGLLSIRASRVTVQGSGLNPRGTRLGSVINQRRTIGQGGGGRIEVVADELRLLNGGGITSETGTDFDPLRDVGPGGDVEIQADRVFISGRADGLQFLQGGRAGVFALSFSPSQGGSIRMRGRELVVREDGIITASATSNGDAGNVDLQFERIDLATGGTIRSGSEGVPVSFLPRGPGDAGSITINAETIHAETGASISVGSMSSDAGNLTIAASQGVELFGSTISAEVTAGAGGDIAIASPDWVILDNGSRIVADAQTGQGGNIAIETQALLVSEESAITASSQFGVDGEVEVTSPFTDVAQSASALRAEFFVAPESAGDRCEAGSSGEVGSFLIAGTRSLPADPDRPLWSPLGELD